jgi:predicted aspartyl protease
LSHQQQDAADDEVQLIGVVAPLTYSGPYACLGLDFHHLNQSIDFILDTGANINAIQRDIAQSFDLETVLSKESLSIESSAGVGGPFQAGDIVLLGDCHLARMPKEQSNVVFMTNLTAAALDIGLASAVGRGLLGTSFFECFPAGVEFDWYGTDGDPPTVIFYYGRHLPDCAKKDAFCVPLDCDSFFGIPVINIGINGVYVSAIVDTGSCISIVSPETARSVGLERLKVNAEVMGIDKEMVTLVKAANATVTIGNASFADVNTMFIGELPGMSLAGGVGTRVPQALLGLDVLKRMYRLILRLSENELWFEDMHDKINE